MSNFKDYNGKEISQGDTVLLPTDRKFIKGTVCEIYGNRFNVICEDGFKRDCGFSTILSNYNNYGKDL